MDVGAVAFGRLVREPRGVGRQPSAALVTRERVAPLLARAAEEAPVAAEPAAQPPPKPALTVAVLGFAAGENLPKDMGANLSALLSAYLSTQTDAPMVEREELTRTLDEQGLSLSGMASSISS